MDLEGFSARLSQPSNEEPTSLSGTMGRVAGADPPEALALGHRPRNWRTRRGEIDLIAYDGPYIVFAEVKTRRLNPDEDRSAQHNFNSRKGRKMEQLAILFCRRHSLTDVPFRLDLIAIETANRRDFALTHYILPERIIK